MQGVVIEIPASDHMIKNAYGWSVDRAMKASIDTTLAAKEAGLYTVFFTIDATRTEVNQLLDIVERVATEGHMDAFTLADTMGVCTPDAITLVVRKAIDRLKKPVEIHCHQDFGLGVANTVAALAAGASVAQTTITGLGERDATCRWKTRQSLLCLHGKDIGIRTEKFCEVSRSSRLGESLRSANRPIVGEKLYEVESGIIAVWYEWVLRISARVTSRSHRSCGRTEAGVDRARKEFWSASMEEWCEKDGCQSHRGKSGWRCSNSQGEIVREERSADV